MEDARIVDLESVNDMFLDAWNSMPPHQPSILSMFLGKITRGISNDKRHGQTAENMGRKKAAVLLAVLGILGLCACNQHSDNGQAQFAQEYKEYGGDMLVLGLENDTVPTENGVVYLDAIDDNLNIQFANLTDKNSEYILKLFLDYSEISYMLNGEYKSEYIFTANAGESLVIPVTLDPNIPFDTSHILTIAILTAPNKHAYTLDLMSNSYGMVLSYELANSNGERHISLDSDLECVIPDEYLSLSYQGIMLNLDFDIKDNVTVKFPPPKIIANPNEKITLAYRAGNYEVSEDAVVILLVDWTQQNINGTPFLYLENNPGYVGYGTLEFCAPTEAGEYEITAFIVADPYGLKGDKNFRMHDTSYRFTLIVE